MTARHAPRQQRRREAHDAIRRRRVTTTILFVVAALVVVGVAAFLAIRPLQGLRALPSDGVRPTVVTMAGFDPSALHVPAGTPVALRFVNPDSPYHTDGGGWHQFRIDALAVDVRIPPRSERTLILPALRPGTYTFYCDLCCGGKDNPSMRGILQVI